MPDTSATTGRKIPMHARGVVVERKSNVAYLFIYAFIYGTFVARAPHTSLQKRTGKREREREQARTRFISSVASILFPACQQLSSVFTASDGVQLRSRASGGSPSPKSPSSSAPQELCCIAGAPDTHSGWHLFLNRPSMPNLRNQPREKGAMAKREFSSMFHYR